MNQHLSPEQIDRWMAGERPAASEQHTRECPECRAKIAKYEGTLSQFRGAVHEWSEQQSTQTVWKAGASPRRWTFQPMRWALAGVALLLIAAIPVYRNVQEKQRAAEQARVEMAQADAALLEQVDAEISRPVAPTLDPLVKLVAWDSTATGAAANEQNTRKGQVSQ